KILESKSETFGFDAANEEYVDLIEKGIVDPAKVVRRALQDAASVAGLLVTTGDGRRSAKGASSAGDAGRRRHGWHGRRHGLLSLGLLSLASQKLIQGPGQKPGPFS